MNLDSLFGEGAEEEFVIAMCTDSPASISFTESFPPEQSGLNIEVDSNTDFEPIHNTKAWVFAHINWTQYNAKVTLKFSEDKEIFVGEGFCVKNILFEAKKIEIIKTAEETLAEQPSMVVALCDWGIKWGATKFITDMLTQDETFMKYMGYTKVSGNQNLSRWEAEISDNSRYYQWFNYASSEYSEDKKPDWIE